MVVLNLENIEKIYLVININILEQHPLPEYEICNIIDYFGDILGYKDKEKKLDIS